MKLALLALQAVGNFGVLQFLAEFLIFILVVAVVILGFRWLTKKLGWAPDPELITIVDIVVFLVLLLLFLGWLGAIPGLHL